jgi:hypothetical protein
MRTIRKSLTYEFDNVNQLNFEMEKEEAEGWIVKTQGKFETTALTDKIYCTVEYLLRD